MNASAEEVRLQLEEAKLRQEELSKGSGAESQARQEAEDLSKKLQEDCGSLRDSISSLELAEAKLTVEIEDGKLSHGRLEDVCSGLRRELDEEGGRLRSELDERQRSGEDAQQALRTALSQREEELQRTQEDLRIAREAQLETKAVAEQGGAASEQLRSQHATLFERLSIAEAAEVTAATEAQKARERTDELNVQLEAAKKVQEEVQELKEQCDRERNDAKQWRGIIIEEQNRNRELQDQLTEANKERKEARRGEAAKTREAERFHRQLELAERAAGRPAGFTPEGSLKSSPRGPGDATSASVDDQVEEARRSAQAAESKASGLVSECESLRSELRNASETKQHQEDTGEEHGGGDQAWQDELQEMRRELAEERRRFEEVRADAEVMQRRLQERPPAEGEDKDGASNESGSYNWWWNRGG